MQPEGSAGHTTIIQDVMFGEAGGARLLLDCYLPATSGPRPGILLVHGGGWQEGDKAGEAEVAQRLAASGYAVFSANYRLAPAHCYPAALDDVQRAVRWIRANADEYGVEAERIGAYGLSAGGHLVSLLGVRETREPGNDTLSRYSSRVTCVVNGCGPTDLRAVEMSSPLRGFVTAFMGADLEAAWEIYREASPLAWVSADAAPFLFVHGEMDELVPLRHSEALHRALKVAGVASTLVTVPDLGHDGAIVARAWTQIMAFFDQHLMRQPQ